ncbi:MAG: ice-binding family protein [Bacteroidales bacterium]
MKTNRLFVLTAALLFLIPSINFGQSIDLGTAANFAVFTANGAVSNTGISQITGHVGSNNGSSTGFGNVNGVMHDIDGVSDQCSTDLLIAYNQLNSAIPTFFPSALLGNGDTLVAGIYSIASAATLNLDLILDAEGDPNAKFIFKINGSFSTSAHSKIKLINGALACNVFWKIEGLVSIATGTFMKGNIIANNAAIVLTTNDTIEGRVLSTAGAITIDGALIYTPIGCSSPYLTGPTAPNLLSTQCFTIFSGDGPVYNTGVSQIIGSVGTNLGLTTGFDPLLVTNGVIHPIPDDTTAQCAADLLTVYNYLNLLPYDIELLYPVQFGRNLVLTPHTYIMNGATTFTDSVYLNAQGNPNAVFVIKINGALTTSTYSNVILINGAQAKNVYWLVQGAVNINNYSVFCGTLVVNNGAIEIVNTGVVLNGRALSTNGAITTTAITTTMTSVCNMGGNIDLDTNLAIITTPVEYGTQLTDIPYTITPTPSGFVYQVDWIYNGIDSNTYQPLVSETSNISLFTVRLTKLIGAIGSGVDPGFNPKVIPVIITVYKDTITVSGINAANKVYNGTNVVSSMNSTNVTYNTFANLADAIITRNGILDDLVFNFSAITSTFSDANAGIGKIVNFTVSPTVSGLSLPNYLIIYSTITANITKSPFVTMKLKSNKPLLPNINYPASFTVIPVSTDFDFSGFIGSEASAFVVNFVSEDFRYSITQNGEYKNILSPQPGIYDVVVNKSTDTDSLRNGAVITLINPSNIAILANYEGIEFLVSPRTQIVNSTPVTVVFPISQNITEYGWTLKEIYTSTMPIGEQVVTATSYLNVTKIHVISGTNYIIGTFKWVYPNTFPNVTSFPGDTASYIFLPNSIYGGAYGDTIYGQHHIILNKADLAITTPPSTSSIHIGQTLGEATITSPSGEVIHKNKLTIVYSSTINPTIGNWSYINPTEVINFVGNYSKNIQFTLTSPLYLRNYNSPVTITDLNTTATVSVIVNKVTLSVTWPTTTAITYGQTLADVVLIGTHYAVNPINNAFVPGTFVWANATTVTPANPNNVYKLRFIPTDLVNYYTDSTMISLTINKAIPTIDWGTFSTITYGENLSDITVTSQTAVNPITGLAINSGVFDWINPSIEPNVNNSGFIRRYTPTDLANYETVQSSLLPVIVNKANPVVTQTLSPYIITYGQMLPTITATAINANNNVSVNGTYEWIYTVTQLPQAGAVAQYQVRFTPTGFDAENYNIVYNSFNVLVNKAKPNVVAPSSTSLIYEQTLAESQLIGGSAMNPYSNVIVGGTFVWTLPTTIPNAGSNGYPVVFVPQDANNYVNSDPIDVVVEVAKKHIDIVIYDLEHIYDGDPKNASFSDSEDRVDLTGMIDAKYYKDNTSTLIIGSPIEVGAYRVIATILPTENYEGCDTAVLVINKDLLDMTDVEIVNAIVRGMNPYFRIGNYDQLMPITVKMINANGNQVYQSENYTNNFDMTNLPNGTYFYIVTFTLNNSEYTKNGRVEVIGQ